MSQDTTNSLQRVEVFDLNGNSVLISDLWKDRKAVVAFARHFGYFLLFRITGHERTNTDRRWISTGSNLIDNDSLLHTQKSPCLNKTLVD